MDKNYFESLANSIQDTNQVVDNLSGRSNYATLTVKIDIDCKLYCDGDFLDLVEANKVKKIPVEVGQHLITVESENVESVSEDREVSFEESGKNYLLVIKDLHEKEVKANQLADEKRLAEEQKRKEAELKKKEEEEQRKKEEYLSNTDFVAKYYDSSKNEVIINDPDLEAIKATEILPALKKGNASASFIYAMILMKQYPKGPKRTEQQESEIQNSLKYAADKDIVEAQYWMGLHLLCSDHDVALNYLRTAAEKGNPNAQYKLGDELIDGENNDEASMWCMKALKNGCLDASNSLEYLWVYCGVLNPDYLPEMERIAEAGNALANYRLFDLYYNGIVFSEADGGKELLAPNIELGIKYLQRSASLGNPDAQYELGHLYEEGEIPDEDGYLGMANIDEAIKWYKKAADQGYERAINRLKEI